MKRGRLISFEGIDRSGKSLQAKRLADWLGEQGQPCLLTFEPGSSDIGKQLRKMLLDKELVRQPLTCALLFAADRHEHVKSRIEPALAAGKWVICDRFRDSTLAYQGGQGIDEKILEQLNDLACEGLQPDLSLLMRISPQTSLQRHGDNDYFETGDCDYMQQVAANYDRLATSHQQRFAVLDGEQPPDLITELVRKTVIERFNEIGK
ncbi:MAG: dTMP kinase [Betaproteobacteria bacterium]|nr:dTMP kinase [Betaproteobacteria bacterium]